MADQSPAEAAIQRLKESKPPATDAFTYLTIIEKSVSPETLPTLLEILEDANLTRDIGWDLVETLIRVPGSEDCLEAVARLGNPREVIIKTLEVMEKLEGDEEDDEGDDDADQERDVDVAQKFTTLVGMLGILHKRLEVKAPSRFLHTTLQTMYHAYQPTSEATAAVISFVRTVASKARPPLPTRKSSTTLSNPFQISDSTKNAPDPEADRTGKMSPVETQLMNRLLQAFITCIIEAYVNSNEMEWSSRLLELYRPGRVVPGRKTMMEMFKEDETLLARDALVGQLVALAGDLGLTGLSSKNISELYEAPLRQNPLETEPDPEKPDEIKLCTGGFWCLAAYWIFASEAFDGNYDKPDMNIFPDHLDMMQRFLGDEPQSRVMRNPGTIEALLVMGLWLEKSKRMAADSVSKPNFMAYHHLLTLCAIFHSSLNVRNVATNLAGFVFHADPDDEDRLKILDDLLENCVFASIQACAVTWLREELVIAVKEKADNCFSSSEAIESLQYTLFPNVSFLKDMDMAALWDYWLQNHTFHLQVANFAYLLFAGSDFKHLVPEGMPAAVEQRYVEPLIWAAKTLQEGFGSKQFESEGVGVDLVMQLGILVDRLESLPQ